MERDLETGLFLRYKQLSQKFPMDNSFILYIIAKFWQKIREMYKET